MRRHLLPQHAADLAAGRVARVQHAAHAVRRLAPERRAGRRVAIERRAPLDQLADVARSLVRQHVDGVGHAQAVAGGDRVARVQLRRIVRADGRGDAALRVAGVALARIGLGEDDDAPASASEIAARKPAMPLPITRKSPPMCTVLSYQRCAEEPERSPRPRQSSSALQ